MTSLMYLILFTAYAVFIWIIRVITIECIDKYIERKFNITKTWTNDTIRRER